MRQCVEREEIAAGSAGEARRLTISCGVASYPLALNSSLGWQGIVECADKAPYEAKAARRNCVVAACPDYAGILRFQPAENILPPSQLEGASMSPRRTLRDEKTGGFRRTGS